MLLGQNQAEYAEPVILCFWRPCKCKECEFLVPYCGVVQSGWTYLWVSCQDLVLHLVDGSVDGGNQLFPAHAQSFHGILSVTVFENKGFLNLLVDALQFFQVRFELVNGLLVFAKPRQLVFQRSLKCTKCILVWHFLENFVGNNSWSTVFSMHYAYFRSNLYVDRDLKLKIITGFI